MTTIFCFQSDDHIHSFLFSPKTTFGELVPLTWNVFKLVWLLPSPCQHVLHVAEALKSLLLQNLYGQITPDSIMSKFLCEASGRLAPTFLSYFLFSLSRPHAPATHNNWLFPTSAPGCSKNPCSCISGQEIPSIHPCLGRAFKALLICASSPKLSLNPLSKIISSISKHCVHTSHASLPLWNKGKATDLSL